MEGKRLEMNPACPGSHAEHLEERHTPRKALSTLHFILIFQARTRSRRRSLAPFIDLEADLHGGNPHSVYQPRPCDEPPETHLYSRIQTSSLWRKPFMRFYLLAILCWVYGCM